MKCPACGTRNNYYHRYCYFCGEKLGAMIDPPDHEDMSPGQDQEDTGGTAFPSFDEAPSRTDAYTYGNEPEQPIDEVDDIDYFGHTPKTPPDTRQERDGTQDTAEETPGDNETPEPESPAPPDYDKTTEIQRDIAAKISSMEKYMDNYLSGQIGAAEEAAEKEPVFNDSLDFIRIGQEAGQPSKESRPPAKEPDAPMKEPAAPVEETAAAQSPPPPAGQEQDFDPYEDEETGKMIDLLYQKDSQSDDAAYPRRTRRRDEPEEYGPEPTGQGTGGNVVVKIFISLAIIAMIVGAAFVLYNEVLKSNAIIPGSSVDITVTETIDPDTLEDGTAGQRLTLYVGEGGVSASIFGTTYPVEDNRVQQFYSDEFLYRQYEAAGDSVQDRILPVDVTVYGKDGKSLIHVVNFTLPEPYVALAIFSPEGDTPQVEGNTCTLEISVQPGAQLFINDVDYTAQVGEDGLAAIEMDMTGVNEMPLTIRATLEGYQDSQREITLIRAQIEEENLLVINESIPVPAESTDVTLTGQVPAGAVIQTSLPLLDDPAIDESGAFTIHVQIPDRPGYSVCLIQVSLNGTQIDQREVIIDKLSTFGEYTTGPWEFRPYSDYKASPDLHAGYRFKIPGRIKDIVSQSDGLTVFTLDINPEGVEQLVRVWYWGDFSHESGASVIVYGNRWGNEESIPRILAKYAISS